MSYNSFPQSLKGQRQTFASNSTPKTKSRLRPPPTPIRVTSLEAIHQILHILPSSHKRLRITVFTYAAVPPKTRKQTLMCKKSAELTFKAALSQTTGRSFQWGPSPGHSGGAETGSGGGKKKAALNTKSPYLLQFEHSLTL